MASNAAGKGGKGQKAHPTFVRCAGKKLFCLFDRDRFCKVAGFVDIQSLGHADIVAHQLQRHHRKARRKEGFCLGHIDRKVHRVLDGVTAKAGQPRFPCIFKLFRYFTIPLKFKSKYFF